MRVSLVLVKRPNYACFSFFAVLDLALSHSHTSMLHETDGNMKYYVKNNLKAVEDKQRVCKCVSRCTTFDCIFDEWTSFTRLCILPVSLTLHLVAPKL